MNKLAVEKARLRLGTAKSALDQIRLCKSIDRFRESWYVFLVSAKNIYTILEQGAKISPQSRQWFGGIADTRKKDPLLQYLYQARNDEEHGLNPVLRQDQTVAGVVIDTPEYKGTLQVRARYAEPPGDNASITLNKVGNYVIKDEDRLVIMRLVRVYGRGGTFYDPPTEHLGVPLTSDWPHHVGDRALTFLETVIDEAAGLV